MKIRCMTEYDDDVKQWVAMSLEFGLATQADSALEAKQKLIAQIADYIEELNNLNKTEQAYLLNRKAPFEWYPLYYWLAIKSCLQKNNRAAIFSQAVNNPVLHV